MLGFWGLWFRVGGGLYHHFLYGICATHRGPSVRHPLQLPCSFRYFRYSSVIQLRCSCVCTSVQLRYGFRYSSVIQVRYRSVVQFLLLLRLRYSFRYSIATASRAPLQPSDTAPLQLRETVTAPLLSVTVSVTSPVTGEHFCHSRGLQMMVEPRPKFRV